MYLKPIANDIWKVYAIVSDRGSCQLLEFLEGLGSAYQPNVAALLALFGTIAEHPNGPRALPDSKCHTIADGIWQITSGRLRVAWFYDEGRVMVCAHGFFKDTYKTNKLDRNAAINAREAYFKAKRSNSIVIEEEKE